jgi:phosphatidylglycerol:prolipoprotein diacylglycerol transferase
MARRRAASGITKHRVGGVAGARSRFTATSAGGVRQSLKPRTAPQAVEPEALVATAWFDSGEEGEPYSATIRFTGRRTPTGGDSAARRTFAQDETIDTVVRGTGPVSITAWVYGLEPGEWTVNAELLRTPTGIRESPVRPDRAGRVPISLAAWSWRHWAVSTATAASLKTRWAPLAPLARQPAVLPGVYLAFAIVGFLVALGSQAAILTREHIDVGSSLAASLIALLAGLIGAKLWYAVLHPDESIIKGGWAVDGFLVVAPLVAVVALRALDLPAGAVLDAVAPGVFLAVAIGRVGCFLTGCCAGRCTAARWGVWSSDRRVGARRIPAQLLESGAGLVIGVATSLVVMADRLPVHGAVFVTSLAAYAVVRQALLRMRAERRASYRTLPMTAAAAGFVVLGVGLFSFHSGPMIAP